MLIQKGNASQRISFKNGREWKSNSRGLYKLVSCLTGSKMDNPMPESSSDRDLANEFVDSFTRENYYNL